MSCEYGCGTVRWTKECGSACCRNRLHSYENGMCVQCGQPPDPNPAVSECRFGRHKFPVMLTPYGVFHNLLPKGTNVDDGTMKILKGPLCSLLSGVSTQDDAIVLLEQAALHWHQSTIQAAAATENIIIGGPFQVANHVKASLSLAFDSNTGQPMVMKYGTEDAITKEFTTFQAFGLGWNDAPGKHLVPLRFITVKEKRALLMPAYRCSFDSVPWAPTRASFPADSLGSSLDCI